MQNDPITESDRIAVTNLFKLIAEYGRRVRERQAAKPVVDRTVTPDVQAQTIMVQELEQN